MENATTNQPYQLQHQIRRDGDAVQYIATYTEGRDAGSFCVVRQYEPSAPSMERLSQFMQESNTLAQISNSSPAYPAALSVQSVSDAALVSKPFRGITLRAFWEAGSTSSLTKLAALLPALRTVVALNRQSLWFPVLTGESIYVNHGRTILADFGSFTPFEPWQQAYALGVFLQNAPFDQSQLPTAYHNAVKRALYTDPLTRYPDASAFVLDLESIAAFAPSQPYAGQKRNPLAIVLAVFFSLTILTFIVIFIIKPYIQSPKDDISGVGDAYTDSDDGYIDTNRAAVQNDYVWVDFMDAYSLYNGLAAAHGNTAFYRIRDKSDVMLIAENMETGAQTVILRDFLPAFIVADENYVYFTDCLDEYRLYRMGHDGAQPTRLTETAALFTIYDSARKLLIYSDGGNDGGITTMDTSTLETRQLTDMRAGLFAYDEPNGTLYYTETYDDEICALTIASGNVERFEIYGFEKFYEDGSLYYMDAYGPLCRLDVGDGSISQISAKDILAFILCNGVIFYVDINSGYFLYSMDANGKNQQLLLREDIDMLWLANGKIYYSAFLNNDGYSQMKRCDLDGSNAELLDR